MEEKNSHENDSCCTKNGCCSKPCWKMVIIIGLTIIVFLSGYGFGSLINNRHYNEGEGCPMMRYNRQSNGWQRQLDKNEQLPNVNEQAERPTSTIQN